MRASPARTPVAVHCPIHQMMMIMVIVMIINSLEVGLGGGRSPRQGRQITLELRRPKLGANKSSFADVEKYLIDNV